MVDDDGEIRPTPALREESKLRQLPADPAEFDKAIGPFKIYGRFITTGVDTVYKAMDVRPLSPVELDQGTDAFAAYFYQHQTEMRAEILLLLWFGGTGAPRVAEFLQKRKKAVSVDALRAQIPASSEEAKAA